jgi:Fe2+ transport system protein FeoA
VTIDEAALDQDVRLRLSELGIRAGGSAKVLHRSSLAGTVLACGGQRLALDSGTAKSVRVKLPERRLAAA